MVVIPIIVGLLEMNYNSMAGETVKLLIRTETGRGELGAGVRTGPLTNTQIDPNNK